MTASKGKKIPFGIESSCRDICGLSRVLKEQCAYICGDEVTDGKNVN